MVLIALASGGCDVTILRATEPEGSLAQNLCIAKEKQQKHPSEFCAVTRIAGG